MVRIEGVIPVLATTFDEEGGLDLDSQARLVEYLLEAGAHGLGLFGNASEGYTLADDERRELLRVIARQVDGRVPLVVSTGHTGTDAAVRASREAEDLGASALMIQPPHYLKPSGEGIFVYFERIAHAVRIPIMVQDAPLMTQVVMSPDLLARMSREIENARLMKVEAPPTAPKFTAIRKAGCTAALLSGLNGNFLPEEHQRGSRGVMPGSDLIPEFVGIWNALESGEPARSWELFTRILPLIRYELQPGLGVSAMKTNLAARRVIRCSRVRHPTATLDSEGLRELERLRRWTETACTDAAAVS
jgi:4-hydroxy-tetrahydrodipicolinate synthase